MVVSAFRLFTTQRALTLKRSSLHKDFMSAQTTAMDYGGSRTPRTDFHMTNLHREQSLRPRLPLLADLRKLRAERDKEETLPSTGTVDDEDDPNDEREDENEPPERGDEDTELPEEFETDDEDDLGHPEDDDADEEDEE